MCLSEYFAVCFDWRHHVIEFHCYHKVMRSPMGVVPKENFHAFTEASPKHCLRISSQRRCLGAAWYSDFHLVDLRLSSSVVVAVAPFWQIDIQATALHLVFDFPSPVLSIIILCIAPFLFGSPASTTRSCEDIQKSTNLGERIFLVAFVVNLTWTSVLIFLPVGDLRIKRSVFGIFYAGWWQLDSCH